MSHTASGLRRRIDSAGDLRSVVRTMKALAASSIGQYEQSVRALAEYDRAIELGLGACLRAAGGRPASMPGEESRPGAKAVGAVLFGSDQGLVGQFNEVVADFAVESFGEAARPPRIWAVGERMNARLVDAGLSPTRCFAVPASVQTIAPLVGDILLETESRAGAPELTELHLFYNHPTAGTLYEPVGRQLLPLDEAWRRKQIEVTWPTPRPAEVLGGHAATLRTLIREYLFISIFRACAESLASENASRLSAMQRAEKNIDDLLEELTGKFHAVRQSTIDEELFEVIASVEAL